MEHWSFLYASLNYRTCPIHVRELFTGLDNPAGRTKISKRLQGQKTEASSTENLLEWVALSTCNRYDLCLWGEITTEQIQVTLYEIYCESAQQKNSEKSLVTFKHFCGFLEFFSGKESLYKLFRVATSLDSLVIGEQQILGQVKQAYQTAQKEGFTASRAAHVFEYTFHVAKTIRWQTGLGNSGVSVGYAAVEMILKVFENLPDKKILILGAGVMARLTAQHFIAAGANQLYVANRTYEKALALKNLLPNKLTHALNLEDALTRLGEFDVCLVAIGGNTDYLLTQTHFERSQKQRHHRIAVALDISVPRKIDPLVGNVQNVFFFHTDDLDAIMREGHLHRQKSAQEAEKLLQNLIVKFINQQTRRKQKKEVAHWHKWILEVSQAEIEKSLGKSQFSQEKIKTIAQAIGKKMASKMLSQQHSKEDDRVL